MLEQKTRDLVLIVEDDPNISDMLQTFLRTKQYRLSATSLGEPVIEICQAQNPKLILLDINLPDIDGYEVCRRLRSNLATSHIPIIFLTQRSRRDDKIMGLNSGADDYITKPFDMEELHLRMNSALRRARYRAGIDQASGLPSGPLIEAQLKLLLHRDDWAILFVAVGNFECFTARYQHLKDKFVNYVGRMVQQAVDQVGNFEDFVGRVGAIEFIVVTTPPRIKRLQAQIGQKFSQAMNPDGVQGDNKPLTADLYLEFGVVQAHDGPYGDVRSLGEAITRSRRETEI